MGLRRPDRDDAGDSGLRHLADSQPPRSPDLFSRPGENRMDRDRTFGHGHPGQRHHLSFHSRAGIRERPRVCPELFRRSPGPDPDRGGLPSSLPPVKGVHRLRVFGLRFDGRARLRERPFSSSSAALPPGSRFMPRRLFFPPCSAGGWTLPSSAAGLLSPPIPWRVEARR